jgi:hypothetical protein
MIRDGEEKEKEEQKENQAIQIKEKEIKEHKEEERRNRMRSLKPSKLFFFIIAVSLSLTVFCFLVDSVQAHNVSVTFSDLNLQKGIKILVYNNTGDLIGEFNTTDTVELDANQSYIFILKPTEQVWFSDPLNALQLFIATTPKMLAYFLFFIVILSSAWLITRLFR